jgi:hypothetical protein
MAVTDYPGGGYQDDWLAQLLGNQAYGGTPPGGSAQGYPASSGQQANMGYPSVPDMGPWSPQATGAPQPQAAQPQSGLARYLAALNPISSAEAAPLGAIPRGTDPYSLPPRQPGANPSWFPRIIPRSEVNPADVSLKPGDPGFLNSATPNATVINPIGATTQPPPQPPTRPGPSVQGPLAYRPEDSPSAGPVVNEPSIRARMPAAVSPAGTAQAPRPGAGAGPGRTPSGPAAVSPDATAGVSPAPSRFTWIDRPNMSANAGPQGGGGPPGMTALNLAGLFGGGGTAAGVNPVATASVQGPLASTGRNYPLPPTMPDDVLAARRAAAIANAGRHSGYQ